MDSRFSVRKKFEEGRLFFCRSLNWIELGQFWLLPWWVYSENQWDKYGNNFSMESKWRPLKVEELLEFCEWCGIIQDTTAHDHKIALKTFLTLKNTFCNKQLYISWLCYFSKAHFFLANFYSNSKIKSDNGKFCIKSNFLFEPGESLNGETHKHLTLIKCYWTSHLLDLLDLLDLLNAAIKN